MKLLVYSAKEFEIPFLNQANNNRHKITYLKDALDSETAIKAANFNAVSIFSGDDANGIVLEKLWDLGVKYIVIRSTGFNNIQIKPAYQLGFKIANAPNYSSHAIAEHATGLLLALNRKLILADKQVHQSNFLLDDLMGFNLHGKTVGIIGTGSIGSVMAKIMHGFGCKIIAHDLKPNIDLVELCNVKYTSFEEVCRQADIITLHIPLSYENHQLISEKQFSLMKKNVILINTSRGAIIEHKSLIQALEQQLIAGYGADVYEKEKGIFFRDHSKNGIKDGQLNRLLSFSNVLLTPHQGFVTVEALESIANITIQNLNEFEENKTCQNEIGYETLIL
ncbi:2-hydroxyacid dehydrogenase [Aurantibacter crassamenti]|uniref:2-hydroxyacid dehydrogenase n=1 Tax=Aurantibacter crassamenti TaxID=1837375 RepID=UPI00193A4102|nr:2-hydroxyacid dehydrogenase [Aurantibacter crassamenti]MBM1106593.1 2-hydroxyacid dehydrogenase [Aurantibacter crassamenti]